MLQIIIITYLGDNKKFQQIICWNFLSFLLIIKHTVSIALKVGVCDLSLELLTHTLYVLAFAYFTGTIAAFCFQTFFYGLNDLFVFVKSYFHIKAR